MFRQRGFAVGPCCQLTQHAMSPLCAEGLLERLTGPKAAGDDEVSALLKSAVLYVVPNMCLDGAVRYLTQDCNVLGWCYNRC